MQAGRHVEDPFDALIRHNQELLAWAESIREECQHRRVRCREALMSAQTAYENALQRQRLWARRQQRVEC
jgi:hypothetical protein